MRRSLLSVLIAAALALAAPAVAQAPPAKGPLNADAVTRFPPPGRMVDIGGRRLHLDCRGVNRGPTVILETGALASSLYYKAARDEVAKVANVCLYDRAGLGWSDPPPSYPRKGGVKGPYILAGHSMGGLIVREYVRKYPTDVVGVVLVEASEPAFNGEAGNVARVKATVGQLGMAVTAAQAGIDIPQLKAPRAPPEEPVALRASVFRAGQDDLANMATVLEQLGDLGSLGDLPLVVVRRGTRDPGMTPAMNDGWIAAQERNAKLSSKGVLLVAEKSGHMVNAEAPELYREAVTRVLAMRR